jgi:Ca2+-transporting ATPase
MAADQVTAGLSEQEAALRLARDGYNDLPAAERRNFWRIVLDVAREPMFALLLAGGLVYGAIGDRADAAILFAFATISVSIAVIQRGRSERVLAALSDLTSPRALVIRSAQRRRIPGREVVAGDTLVLVEGDRVPADGIVISCADLLLDESLLTGESLPVLKQAADAESWHAASPGGDDLANVFSGTLVVRGTALAVATATGERSEIGKIGRAVVGTEMETPRLQQQTKKLLLTFAAASISLSVLAVALYGYLHRDWLHALLGGISLGMSLLSSRYSR